jgi:hypothetical protein
VIILRSGEYVCDPSAFSGIFVGSFCVQWNTCGIILRSVEYLCGPSAFSGLMLAGSLCVQRNIVYFSHSDNYVCNLDTPSVN